MFKFGDAVINKFASINNPRRCAFFVSVVNNKCLVNRGKHARLTDGKGKFWEVEFSAIEK